MKTLYQPVIKMNYLSIYLDNWFKTKEQANNAVLENMGIGYVYANKNISYNTKQVSFFEWLFT